MSLNSEEVISMKQTKNNQGLQIKGNKHSIRRLLKYVFKYYNWQLIIVFFCIIFSSVSSVAGSYFVGNILIDEFIEPALKTSDPYNSLWSMTAYNLNLLTYVLILVSVFTISIICSYFYNFVMAVIAQGVQKRIRDQLFEHMQSLKISYFDSHSHGDIMSIYTNDVDALREMLSRAIPQVLSATISMSACMVMMLLTDLLLTGIVVFFAIAIVFISKYLVKMSGKYFIAQQIELGKTNGYIEEMTTGQKVIKVFNYEEKNIEEFKKHNNVLFENSVKANRFASIMMPIVNQLGNLQYALLALVGGLAMVYNIKGVCLTGSHVFLVGTIVSFLLYSKSFIQPIGQLSQQLNIIALALAGSKRIFNLIDEESEVDEGYVELVNAKEDENGNPIECEEQTGKWAWKHYHKDTDSTTYVWLKGKINLIDVDFGYIKDKIILHDINIYAEPGQKVAFVGPTGAGKTTITNLLNRFYDIADGKIRFDDININKIKKADLRRSIGMVFQDTKLFTGTVKENIRFGKLDASDEEIYAAAKLANAEGFINQLPNGYDTVLTNGGANLSQGQRQLLAIARAAIANPPVLILDEATSSIDSRTEALVQNGMDAIMKGRTVFVIAHRLSTIKNSDVIMVLDKGHIIERGSHDSLLEQKGKYYQLYTGNSIQQED